MLDTGTLLSRLNTVLTAWRDLPPVGNPVPALIEIAKILEDATEEYLKQDPDPLDDRHPINTHPSCSLGVLLKTILRNEEFMNKLVVSYLMSRDNTDMCESACRVLLNCAPGFDSAIVFAEPDDLVPELVKLTREGPTETIRAYSCGLLAAAMEASDNAVKHRNLNAQLIPILLTRLKQLKAEMDRKRVGEENGRDGKEEQKEEKSGEEHTRKGDKSIRTKRRAANGSNSPPRKRRKTKGPADCLSETTRDPPAELSHWGAIQTVVIGSHKIHPLTAEMHQRFILQYLAQIGEYQDLLIFSYEGDAMNLIFDYIDVTYTNDIRMSFDALKYLSSLLVHRKFALEFVSRGGVCSLLRVPRSSLASVSAATCLYYLAYASDVMERVCQLSDAVLDRLVEYGLWMLEHSHESGMASSAMFFAHAFPFRAIIERFDQSDGLRNLYNYISTLTILSDPAPSHDLTEEQMQTTSQTLRNACAAFRSYCVSHAFLRLEYIRNKSAGGRATIRFPPGVQFPFPAFKAMRLEDEYLTPGMAILAVYNKHNVWKALDELRRLGIVRLLLSAIVRSRDWLSPNTRTERIEMVKNALEIMWTVATIPKAQRELCEPLASADAYGFSILLLLARKSKSPFPEAEIAFAALRVLITIMSAHDDRKREIGSRRERRSTIGGGGDLYELIHSTLRKNDIIMILNELIRSTSPSDSDELRALACRLMLLMARDSRVQQILSHLPLITQNDLSDLMREPVLPENKSIHSKFCQEAKALLATLTGKSVKGMKKDLTQERLWKAHIVSSTNISYNEGELMELIERHLRSKGFVHSANTLHTEANLSRSHERATNNRLKGMLNLPSANIIQNLNDVQSRRRDSNVYSLSHDQSKLDRVKRSTTKTTEVADTVNTNNTPDKNISGAQLDHIVTEYLRVQHANCTNPVSTCPPFSLFFPHRCPEPRLSRLLPFSHASRWLRSPLFGTRHRIHSIRMDERFAFSRFRSFPMSNDESDEMHSACAFSIDDEHLIVGMYTGEVHFLNVETGSDDAQTTCHHSAISSIVPSRDGSMLLTSSLFMDPLSTLWRLGDTQTHLIDFPDQPIVKFNNRVQDKIIGTKMEVATVYDIETGQCLYVMQDKNTFGLRYLYNVASFSPCDQYVLHDGSLYDVRSPLAPIHVFDKFNKAISGVFHPLGNEIIINSEVWDLRTYGLLHSIPSLDMCAIQFNSTGNVILAAQYDNIDDPYRKQFQSSFRTFDSKDYSVLTTMDTRRPMIGFCLDNGDSRVAVIEKRARVGDYVPATEETVVKMFEVGKVRDETDDAEEDQDRDAPSESDDSSEGFSDESVFNLDFTDDGDLDEDETESEDNASSDDFSSPGSSDDDDEDDEGGEPPGEEDEEDEELDDEDDHSFAPDEEDRHSSSNIVLNPNMRRNRRL